MAEKYLGDLEKTQIIESLVDVPIEQRDDAWGKEFLSNVGAASFRCGDPQVIEGPDGFPYFNLLLPEANVPFECYVIDYMKDDFLLREGFGIVLNADKGNPDWVFSYGDIVNYSLRNEFYSEDSVFYHQRSANEVIQETEQIQVGQPSESILPQELRDVVRSFFNRYGIEPKIYLMNRVSKGGKFQLVFNIIPDMFDNMDTFNAVMGAVSWFFPRDYSIVSREDEGDGLFEPL